MPESAPMETSNNPSESMIDDLIRDILGESGSPMGSPGRGFATTAALFEQAFGSGRGMSRTGTIEKLLVAEIFTSELAEALASELAERLAPKLMKALEQRIAEEVSKKEGPAKPSGTQARKTEPK